ncbi:hypothetical protein BJ165DRAFT_852669 [Panaeolus papilionaceus]|nr:hypothetical protein BJ165DRAFT_852669 [Panaeolus papilionaceus]
MHKSFLTDLLIVFEPKIQVYRSSPYLFAFLLCSSHLNHRPHRGRRPAMHPFPICSCPMFSSCWVWLADYIERRPSLIELDSQELQLIHIREPRHDHHDPHDEPNKNLDKPRWLHSCLDKLVESSIYVPPDDELLKESILIILKILLRIVHISFAFIDISQNMQLSLYPEVMIGCHVVLMNEQSLHTEE